MFKRLFSLIRDAYDSASKRITTGELNRFVEQMRFDQDVEIYYMTQPYGRPPSVAPAPAGKRASGAFSDGAGLLYESNSGPFVNGWQGSDLKWRYGPINVFRVEEAPQA